MRDLSCEPQSPVPKKLSDIEFLIAIKGIGSSEEDDISERDEAILATVVHPVYGWRVDFDQNYDDDQSINNEVEAE